MADSKPNPLKIQEIILNNQIASTQIRSLQTLGGHYLKAVEHLLNISPDQGGKMFLEAVSQVRGIISSQPQPEPASPK